MSLPAQLPELHAEILYNEYNFAAAFAVASLLTLLALVTLGIKTLVELRARKEHQDAATERPLAALQGQAS
ncbi:hypothetical protein AWV80_23475 [Cupriavidus sp. UYMU48A]|nr:hypothetical protein AWV80_23475 [Cupriavidus sp. UYMU48A]